MPWSSSAPGEYQSNQKEPRRHLFNFIISDALETTVELDIKAIFRMNLKKGSPRFSVVAPASHRV